MGDLEKSAEWFTAGRGRRLSLALGVPFAAVGLAVGAEVPAGTGRCLAPDRALVATASLLRGLGVRWGKRP